MPSFEPEIFDIWHFMTLDTAVFGHAAPTTLLSRSETYIGGDCYIVSGSRDSTLLLWYWNGRRRKIVGDSLNPLDNPSPRATLGKFLEKIFSKKYQKRFLKNFKGSLDQIHFNFEINVGKSRIRHRTILNFE